MTDATPLASEQITQEDRLTLAKAMSVYSQRLNGRSRVESVRDAMNTALDAGAAVIARYRIAALPDSPAPIIMQDSKDCAVTSERTPRAEGPGWYDGDKYLGTMRDAPVPNATMVGPKFETDRGFVGWQSKDEYAALFSASPAPSGQGVSGEVEPTARDDAAVYGIGFEVDGKRVHPGRVVMRHRAPATESHQKNRQPVPGEYEPKD